MPRLAYSNHTLNGNKRMKTQIVLTLCFLGLITGAWTSSAQTQYQIDWHTIDGGGGSSTGGVYTVAGTIGQPDAGQMSGGNYSLTGGFWSLIAAVPTPGAPLLSIKLIGNTVMVYWPSPSTGFSPQVNTNLATTNWVTPAETVQDNGSIKYLLVSPPAGNRFYRLKSP
jgi:hypothetical protein